MTTSRPSHHPAGALVALACAAILAALAVRCATGCVREPDGSLKLALPAEQGILAADLAACDALLPLSGLPAGVDAIACQGEEVALKAALDKVTASVVLPDAGAPTLPSIARRAVYRRTTGGATKVCGYVSGHVASLVQYHLDAANAVDAGAEGGR